MENKTILIVDDEERNIKLLKAMLANEDYYLSGVSNGEEALRRVSWIPPDLILLDVMMPGIDGFEVCRRVKGDEKTRMIPVVMVTALSEKEHQIKAMEAGADDFLSKPVNQTELCIRVKSLLRIKSYHDKLLGSFREIAEKNARLQELERAKEGLTHMIIHDLNNPLMAISGSLEMLLLNKNELPEKQYGTIQKCHNYCNDFNLLIRSLLDIHRMEKVKLELQKEETDFPVMVDEVQRQFTQKAELKKISLSFRSPANIPSVFIDQGLIKRVIANLLNNAIRHTPKEGHIAESIDIIPENGYIRFNIKDSGNGLAPEYHQRIFNKFEQVELKREGVFSGSGGLGLAFCKMAVEAHGGRIWVESKGKEGEGSLFRLTIPV